MKNTNTNTWSLLVTHETKEVVYSSDADVISRAEVLIRLVLKPYTFTYENETELNVVLQAFKLMGYMITNMDDKRR